jgi:hypothetical protein
MADEILFGERNDLTEEDYRSLKEDCNREIQTLKSQETMMLLELDSIRRKIRRVRNEKEYLRVFQMGNDAEGELLSMKPQIKGTLTLRFQKLMKRMKSKSMEEKK